MEESIKGTFTEIDLEPLLAQMSIIVKLREHFSTLVTPSGYTHATTRYEHVAHKDGASIQVVVLNEADLMCRITQGLNLSTIYVSTRYYDRVKKHMLEFLKASSIHINIIKIPPGVSF